MTPDIARVLVRDAPEVQAGRLLEHLLRVTGASAGAVLAVEGMRLRAVVDRTTVDRLGVIQRMFGDYHADLTRGVGIDGRGLCLAPLLLEGRLVGLLMLVGVTISGAAVDPDVSSILAAAVNTPPAPTVEALSAEDILREHTIRRLEVFRWNISA